MCLNGTYPFLSATLVRQLPYYLFRETCFMDSYPQEPSFFCAPSVHSRLPYMNRSHLSIPL